MFRVRPRTLTELLEVLAFAPDLIDLTSLPLRWRLALRLLGIGGVRSAAANAIKI